MNWTPFDNGGSIGKRGSEDGFIMLDEECSEGARITLERKANYAPFAITCGIYGWMFHTRYLGIEAEAVADFVRMRVALDEIVQSIPLAEDPEAEAKGAAVSAAIHEFVSRFP